MTPDRRLRLELGQARGLSASSGTDSALMTPNDVASRLRSSTTGLDAGYPQRLHATDVAPADG